MKEILLAIAVAASPMVEVHHGPMKGDFICFQTATMLKDFLEQRPSWEKVLHEKGDGAVEFYFWFNSVPPRSRIVADEVIVFGNSKESFYWAWVLHQGCWLNLFKVSSSTIDVWINKREREHGEEVKND